MALLKHVQELTATGIEDNRLKLFLGTLASHGHLNIHMSIKTLLKKNLRVDLKMEMAIIVEIQVIIQKVFGVTQQILTRDGRFANL